jgi:transcriptional regulator with XRE-family HTH domain
MLRNNQKKQKKCPGPRSAFCDMLRNERLKLHMSQADLGHELGISNSAVSLWEAEGVLPDPPKFERLADILNLSQETREEYAKLKKKRLKGGSNGKTIQRTDKDADL